MDEQESDTRAGRGRPPRSEADIERTRARITEASHRLFREAGVAAVSMRRIAEAAGCSTMTLYSHFGSKTEILRSLWAEILGEVFDRLDRVASAERDPLRRLQAVACGYVDHWLTHRDRYFLTFMAPGIGQQDVSLLVANDAVLARFDLFRRCLAAVLGPDADPAATGLRAELLVCVLHGIAQNLITISAYPWPPSERLVVEAIHGLVGTSAQS